MSALVQVPLGVILKNENIREEMLDILEILHKYVPYKKATGNLLWDYHVLLNYYVSLLQ